MKRRSQERIDKSQETGRPPIPRPQDNVSNQPGRANVNTVSSTIEPVPSTSRQNQDNPTANRVVEAITIVDSDDDSDECINLIDEEIIEQPKSAKPSEPPKKKLKQETENVGESPENKQPENQRWNQERATIYTALRPIKSKDQPKEQSKELNAASTNFDLAMAGILEETIHKTIISLNRQGKRACGFDIKQIHRRTPQGIMFLPVWIAIVDGVDAPRFNAIIWYPESSLANIREAGLTLDHMAEARRFDIVRKNMIDILMEYDMICVANGPEDFRLMSFNTNDWELIRPRIRDVNYYYNPRPNSLLQFDMRLSRFIFFQKVIQNNIRSALIDAMYKLFLYLIDQENFESTFHQISHNVTPPPYSINLYPQNRQMAGLLKRVMEYLQAWPNGLVIEQNPIFITQPYYCPSEFVDATDNLRPPYAYITPVLFQDFIRPRNIHS